jgi:X-X-X-Leu-X-X-Gly heptad repeat protein
MSASRRLTRSVSRSTARRSAIALTTAVGLTSVALVAPASAGVPTSVARFAVGPFSSAEDAPESPVTLDVTYELDGEKISADDLAGKTGRLEVTYLVRNRTTTPTELRFKDGKGEEIVETVDLVAPYVGRLAVALPARAGDIEAEGAEVLTDSLAWSLVLFNPIGEPAQQLKLSMNVSDAVVPEAELQVAKVTPTDGGALARGTAAAEEASGNSTRLTEGVFKIDSSVLKLRDGATQLFDGLVQLADGSAALNEGLADRAAPGAQKLSDGLGTAREGGDKLASGLGQLADGSKTLGAGLTSANDGGKALSAGLDQLVSGGGRLIAGLDSAACRWQPPGRGPAQHVRGARPLGRHQVGRGRPGLGQGRRHRAGDRSAHRAEGSVGPALRPRPRPRHARRHRPRWPAAGPDRDRGRPQGRPGRAGRSAQHRPGRARPPGRARRRHGQQERPQREAQGRRCPRPAGRWRERRRRWRQGALRQPGCPGRRAGRRRRPRGARHGGCAEGGRLRPQERVVARPGPRLRRCGPGRHRRPHQHARLARRARRPGGRPHRRRRRA